MKIFFNTGRLYGRYLDHEGQIIQAEWDGNSKITFYDRTRGIAGVITTCNHNWLDEQHLAKAIMVAYDHGLYINDSTAFNMERPVGKPKRIQL
jgi:hypothetical protein